MVIQHSKNIAITLFFISKICCFLSCFFLTSCSFLSNDLDLNQIEIANNNFMIAEEHYVKRKFEDAIKNYEASLKFNMRYRPKVAVRDLRKIGDCYKELRNFRESEKSYLNALKIDLKYYDIKHPNISRDYFHIAELCYMFGKYSKCKKYIDASLKIDRSNNNYTDIIRDLNILALFHDSLGQYEKAISTYKELITLIKDVYGEKNQNMAKTLNNIGIAYANMKKYKEAISYCKQSLKIDELIMGKKHIYVARDLNNLGILYKKTNNFSEAKYSYQHSLKIYEKKYGNDHPIVAAILCNMGIIYSKEKKFKEALNFLQRALIIAEKSKEPELLWRVYNTLREFYILKENPIESIFFGKRAVNIIQSQRLLISDLDNRLQKTFMTNKKSVFRGLARTLFQQGRYLEGFRIWQMLKDEEYFEFLEGPSLRGDNRVQCSINTIRASDYFDTERKRKINKTNIEHQKDEKYNKLKNEIIQQEKEYKQLCKKITDNNNVRCQEIKANKQFIRKKFFDYLKTDKYKKKHTLSRNNINYLGDTLLEKFTSIKKDYKSVIVIYIFFDKEIDILLLTPGLPIYTTINVSAISLKAKIDNYLKQIQNCKSGNHIKIAKELYSYLIKPIEKHLNEYKANMIMFSLDGPLHNIPLAALYDGKNYVAEKYCLSVYDSDINYEFDDYYKPIYLRASAFGVSKEITIFNELKKNKTKFKELPAVKTELNAISQYVEITPCYFLDEQFTKKKLIEELKRDKKNEIFHIASHFRLLSVFDSSFLLLGDGNKITIDDIISNYDDFKFNEIKLLSLSACETGSYTLDINNGIFECFGKVTLNRGCQSTLATLWKVEDKSTALFMEYFYCFLTNGKPFMKSKTKAKALQKAQRAFITGKKNNFEISVPDERYKHPYFWAPFILMGNWL